MTILLIVEPSDDDVNNATLHALTACLRIGGEIHALVMGEQATASAERSSRLPGIAKVRVAEGRVFATPLAENVGSMVMTIAADYTHIVCAATAFGKSIAPRIAARLDVSQISEITAVLGPDTFERPIYAGNAIATVRSDDAIKVLTVRSTGFDAAASGGGSAIIERIDVVPDSMLSTYVSRDIATQERPELTAAAVVVAGGRGLRSKEQYYDVLAPLADKLGAALGASRAAVDAGFAPNDYQVGQTGKIVAPQLYIAVGISGAIQHLAGMKDAKVIVAINSDAEAPMFDVADYGIVADLFTVVPELVGMLP